MSYARGRNVGAPSLSDESCTEEEKEQITKLPKSTFSSFVSPAERKRRQQAKLDAMKKEQEEKEKAAQPVMEAVVDAVVEPVKVVKNGSSDEDSDSDSDSDSSSSDSSGSDSSDSSSRSSSSSSTARISHVVNSNSPKPPEVNDDKNAGDLAVVQEPETPLVAAVANVESPETSVPDGGNEHMSEIPSESDVQKRKRAAIQAVMKDTSLNPAERNKKIQDIIAGRADLGNVQVTPPLQAPPQAPPVEAPLVTSSTESAPSASDNENNGPVASQTSEHASEIPLESEKQKRKRAAIQAVMRDTSLSQVDRNKKIQDIIAGRVDMGVEEATKPPEVPPIEAAVAIESVTPAVVSAAASPKQSLRKSDSESSEKVCRNVKVASDGTDPAPALKVKICASESTEQPAAALKVDVSEAADAEYQQNLQRQQQQRTNQKAAPADRNKDTSQVPAVESGAAVSQLMNPAERKEEASQVSAVQSAAAISQQTQLYEQRQKELQMQLEQKRKEMEMQMEQQRKALEAEQQRQMREMEHQQLLELEMARQRRLELEQQQREMEFAAEQRRIQQEAENRRQAERHRMEMERLRDLERQQSMRQMQQERERQIQEELDRQRQVDMSRAVGSSKRTNTSNLSAVAAARNLMSRINFFRPPRNSQPKSLRYDGVDDDELNWRLDCYVSLSDFTIVVHRALPGPFAPDFDVADHNMIDVVTGTDGSPLMDVYYVHKVMLAVGGNRSEFLGRRIRDAESTSGVDSPDGHSADVNVHETIMLEGAADTMGIVLDFCYFPHKPVDINVENAVPLVYLAQRYKIRGLLCTTSDFLKQNLESANAVHFLLDAYLYKLDDVLNRAIDVTAANFDDRVDFDPIYKLPPQLFRRIIASPSLKCESELLSLVVYSYCGEHHPDEISVEYFREVTRPKLMPQLDSKVALMMLKFYIDLLMKEDADRDILELLQEDNLTNRCISVIAKNWRQEICEPLMIDAEWEETNAMARRNIPPHEGASLHRTLPPQLQNRILEKCILVAMDETSETEKPKPPIPEKVERELVIPAPIVTSVNVENNAAIIESLRAELEQSKKEQRAQSDNSQRELEELRRKATQLEAEVSKKTKALEGYQQELKKFRRVPGIHNFGSISIREPTVIDKTMCTYSANPDHHYPHHRRGNRPPTQMPRLASEFENLGRENGYVYNDGHGALLPVFYYSGGGR